MYLLTTDEAFSSTVSSGPHCTKSNVKRLENGSLKVEFYTLSVFFFYDWGENIASTPTAGNKAFLSNFSDLFILTEIAFIPCLFLYCW